VPIANTNFYLLLCADTIGNASLDPASDTRHSFATLLLKDGYDIGTVQELLGHRDVLTTMIYADVLNRSGLSKSSGPATENLKTRCGSGIDCGPMAATPAAIARKRGLTFTSQVSDTVQQIVLQSRLKLFGIGGQQRRGLNASLNSSAAIT